MTIAQVVDHLYVIRKKDDRVVVYFLTSRGAYFIPIALVSAFCTAIVWFAVHMHWNGNVLSGIVGGSISMIAVTCFAMAEHLRQFTITINPEVVILQSTFQGIPIGFKKIYPRSFISDLGMYPTEIGRDSFSSKYCTLCIWAGGSSIEIESYFPISEGVSLANDLRHIGIEFPQRRERYDQYRFTGRYDYFSF